MNPTDRSAIDALVDAEEAAAGMSVVEYADALEYERTIVEQHFDPKGSSSQQSTAPRVASGRWSSSPASRKERCPTTGR